MKTFCLLALLVWCTTLVQAQAFLSEGSKQIFASPQLHKQIRKHHQVAILPVTARVAYAKIPKGYNREKHQQQESTLGQNFQKNLYTYLVRKANSYSVSFQDVEQTNALLKEAGMLERLKDFTPAEIAQVLGVDAVLTGQFDLEQSRPDGTAFATSVLYKDYKGKSALGTLTLMLHSGATGELLWRFFKMMDDDFDSANQDLVERMLRKVSRNLPYAI